MSAVPLLDLKAQYRSLRQEIGAAIAEVVEAQAFILGPTVERFESAVAAYVGAEQAIGCASGTDALILSLAALGVGEGDEVVTSPFSFFSSASCAYKVGARPTFADIDEETFNLDPDRIEAAIGARTRAILPVHLFGQCAAMDDVIEIAERRGLALVEDAAQALGTTWASKRLGRTVHAGVLGDLGCYSFFPSKNLGGFGDGGMIVTQDPRLAESLRELRVHGGRQMYHHRAVGWNSRLDALQAAVLAVKLPHLERWCAARAANAAAYDRAFEDLGLVQAGHVRTPRRAPGSSHIFNQYTLRVDRRDELSAHLRGRGLGHAIYYPVPLHLQECFRDLGYVEGDFPRAERACRSVISLPVYAELAEVDRLRVVEAIADFYRAR
jgi:dTDP-4-amino-4,6-dideoxygalactose transaminase